MAVVLPDAAELVALALEADELIGSATAKALLVPTTLLTLLYPANKDAFDDTSS